MARNPEWFAQVRARGFCYICKRAMRDEDDHLAHLVCSRLVNKGWRYARVQEYLRVNQIDPNRVQAAGE